MRLHSANVEPGNAAESGCALFTGIEVGATRRRAQRI
jgi:hypothetical protein